MKKGFTLIEILATIIILAIIFVIAVPQISKIINNSKISIYRKNEEVLIKAASLYALRNQEYYPSIIGDTKEITLNQLQEVKYISEIINPENKTEECKGYVLITKIEQDEYDYTPHIKCGLGINNSVEDRLLGHYKFDENTFDYSTNNNHGILVGNAIYLDGKINQALSFNSGRVETEIPDVPRDMTYSAWFKKTTSNWESIAIIGNRRSTRGWMLYRNSGDTAGYFRWYQHYLTTSDTITSYRAWPGISNLQVGVWYNIVATRTQDGYSNLYLNGELFVASTPPSNFVDWVYSEANISIASGQGSGSTSWQATEMILDEVRIYERILSEEEIKLIYELEK